jgi:hypothetical protein
VLHSSRSGTPRLRSRPSSAAVTRHRISGVIAERRTRSPGAREAITVGLAGNALFGWWWLDPDRGAGGRGCATKEGLETWRGEGCCAAPALSPSWDAVTTTAATIITD